MWCNRCKTEVEVIDGSFCMNCYSPLAGNGAAATAVDPYVPDYQDQQPTALEPRDLQRETILEEPESQKRTSSGSTEKTVFVPPTTTKATPTSRGEADPRLLEGAKIIGWLVSFSHDPRGLDYRLHQGRTCIGSDLNSEIHIDYDTRVSSRHAVIIFRGDKLKITDDYSQNGTLLNGKYLDGGAPTDLADKDVIQIGRTEFTVYLID
jgi:hypothetical protein